MFLDLLSVTDVGRRALAPAEEDAPSEVSECKPRERPHKEEAEKVGAEGGTATVPSHALLHGLCGRGVRILGADFFCLSLCRFLCSFLGALYHSRDRPGWRAKESLQRAVFARTADGKQTVCFRYDLAT